LPLGGNAFQDCSKLLTGGKEKKLRVYDTLKYEADPIVLEGCAEPIKTALWLTDNTILVGCDEPMLRLWDVRADTRKQVQSFNTCAPIGGGGVAGAGASQGGAGAAHGGMELCTLQGGQRVLSVACGSEVQFWDADTFDVKCRHSFDKAAIGYNVSSASLHPGFAPGAEGSVFVAACSDNWVRMYETGTGKELECLKGHHGPVHCIRFSPTGKSYASA
jgi:serine-threonine kinase receptor-associated protein